MPPEHLGQPAVQVTGWDVKTGKKLGEGIDTVLSAARRVDGVFDVYRTTGSQRRP